MFLRKKTKHTKNSDLVITSVITTPLLAEWLVLPRHMILIQSYLNNVLKIANQKKKKKNWAQALKERPVLKESDYK